MVNLTSLTFDTEVFQSTLPVLVLWATPMSIPSNQIAAGMTALDTTKIKSTRVDIDLYPELAIRFSIRQLPLIVLFVAGVAIAEGTLLTEVLKAVPGV